MKKTLIISYYDSGYWWSIAFASKIVTRHDYVRGYKKLSILNEKLCNYINMHNLRSENILEVLHDLRFHYKYDRVIICENGDIEIYKLKRK